jgi:hypothetical protein
MLLIFWRRFDDNSTSLLNQIFFCALASSAIYFTIYSLDNIEVGKFKLNENLFIYSVLSFFVFITIPLQVVGNVDRSRSLYMFGWIECAPKNYGLKEIESAIDSKYGKESVSAFEIRLIEQQSRALVRIQNEKVTLTKKGEFVFATAKGVASVFKLSGWVNHDIWKNPRCLM